MGKPHILLLPLPLLLLILLLLFLLLYFARYENDRLTDITIKVGACTFSAHRVVLAYHSPVLTKQMDKPRILNDKVEIRVADNITPTAFQTVLAYMYKGGMCDL